MVKRVFQLLNKEVNGLHEAAYLLALFAILSQILALFRDRLFADHFGAGAILDTYYAAFRIPDLILVTAASIVSISILIPFLVKKLSVSLEEGKKFIDSIFTLFFGGMVVLSVVAFFATPALTKILFPGIVYQDQLILLTRIMLLQPILIGLSNLLSSVTQVYKKFFVYALSPVLYNVGIVSGIVFFYPIAGVGGLAWGVVLGAMLHLLIQLPVIFDKKLLPRFTLSVNWKDIKQVVLISLPRTVALSLSNLSILFLVSVGSLLGAGSIAVFNFSLNIQSVPLSIIGASYSMAAFPTLVRLFSGGEKQKFLDQMISATRHIIFWSMPSVGLFIVLRAQIVRTILGSGAFDWSDTRLTAAALAIFAISVVAQSLVLIFVRGYYAIGNTKKPLCINLFATLLVVVFGFGLVALFNTFPTFQYFIESLFKVNDILGTSVLMLPLAYSLATIINAVIFWIVFERDFAKFSQTIWRPLFQAFATSVIVGFVAHFFLNIFDDIFNINTLAGIFLQGLLSGLIGILVGIIVLKLLGNEEIKEIKRALHHRLSKQQLLVSDPTENPLS